MVQCLCSNLMLPCCSPIPAMVMLSFIYVSCHSAFIVPYAWNSLSLAASSSLTIMSIILGTCKPTAVFSPCLTSIITSLGGYRQKILKPITYSLTESCTFLIVVITHYLCNFSKFPQGNFHVFSCSPLHLQSPNTDSSILTQSMCSVSSS